MRTPCHYFPLENGRYEIKPGLSPLQHDFGNGAADQAIFQLDCNFSHYRNCKLAARRERLDKFILLNELSEARLSGLVSFLIQQLCLEHPQYFKTITINPGIQLHCHLTQEILLFDRSYRLVECHNCTEVTPAYINALDAILMQLQEDMALVELCKPDEPGEHGNKLIALHLCFPNHWAAEDKIGGDFIAVHGPVPGMEKINQRADQLIQAMLKKGPYVRFAWGLVTSPELNQHPSKRLVQNKHLDHSRDFNPAAPELYLRVERQVVKGFSEMNLVMFCIRTYLYDINILRQDPDKRQQLVAALQSMPGQSQVYKGLKSDLKNILDWL